MQGLARGSPVPDRHREHEERRAHPRYSPDPWLPVVLSAHGSELRAAGHIVDISEGGIRIVAPPSCPVPFAWGHSIELMLAYSESARRFGFEGIVLAATVVRVVSDERAYTIQARFREPRLHRRIQDYIRLLAREQGPDAVTTSPVDRR